MRFKNTAQRKAVMAKLKRQGDTVLLTRNSDVLAKMKVKEFGDESIRISDWKTLKKGKGYGKELIRKYIKKHPEVWDINTDGFTEAGAKSIEKALPNFRITIWRHGTTTGIGKLMRQDAIDYYVDRQMEGRRSPIYVNPQLRSKRIEKVNQ
jgi:hypothetical protein